MVSVWTLIAIALSVLACGAHAQTQPADSKPAEPKPDLGAYQTFYLTGVSEQHDANDVVTDLRNMLPRARIYRVESQNAISVRGTSDDLQLAQKILSDIDRPRKIYRLTYSISETEGGKSLGTQKVSMIVSDSGEKTILKQGSKVPIVTGTTDPGTATQNSQVQYEDVGLSIEASVAGSPGGVRLRTKVEQSSIAEGRPGASVMDPIIHQTVLDGTSTLAPGKPLLLGSLDIPGSTRQEEVEVVSEAIP
jgi:type II secretory pathway component GspD/PulD (secretin)